MRGSDQLKIRIYSRKESVSFKLINASHRSDQTLLKKKYEGTTQFLENQSLLQRGFSENLLGTVFSNAALGNSLIAIISGVAAQFVAERFGFVAPFDLALSILLIMAVIIMNTWPENYGNEKAPVKESFQKATKAIREGEIDIARTQED